MFHESMGTSTLADARSDGRGGNAMGRFHGQKMSFDASGRMGLLPNTILSRISRGRAEEVCPMALIRLLCAVFRIVVNIKYSIVLHDLSPEDALQ